MLDGLNTAPPDASEPRQVALSATIQSNVIQQAAKYLESMKPGTRIAVLGLSRSLRVLQNFTSDPALAGSAARTMDMNLDGHASTLGTWCSQQIQRNRMTLEALNQIAADLTKLEGKKNLIWFTAGFPTITDPRANGEVVCNRAAANLHPDNAATPKNSAHNGPFVPEMGDGLEDFTQPLLKTYGLLASAQVAVFPISAAALGHINNPTGLGSVPPATEQWAEVELDGSGTGG